MTICSVRSNQLEPIREMFPNSVYWQARTGQADVFGLQDDNGVLQAVMAAELRGLATRLLWLWVAPDYRRQGLGRMLLLTLMANGHAAGTNWLEADFPMDGNLEMSSLMISLNAPFRRIGSLYTTTLGEVELSRLERHVRQAVGTPLGQADSQQKKDALRMLRTQGMPAYSAPVAQCYDSDLSRLYFHGGALRAMLLIEAGAHLCVSYLWCEKEWSYILPGLLVCCLRAARERYPADTELYTGTIAESASRLSDTFLPKAKKTFVFRYRLPIS